MQVFMDLLEQGRAPYQVVSYGKQFLKEQGFVELDFKQPMKIERGGRYMIAPYPSMLFAFSVGASFGTNMQKDAVRIAMAHTDFPCFKLKSKPEYTTKEYLQVNVEPYGGMIKGTWFDRPLGLAGKVMLAGEDAFTPKCVIFDSERALFTIPSLAPHMDRGANNKHEYDMQTELQPVTGMLTEACSRNGFLQEYLAKELNVDADEILSFDLFLYNMDHPECIGLTEEFVSAPRIDNLASVAALLEGITVETNTDNLSVIALFDNEEIGSRSKQGADSLLLRERLMRIKDSLQLTEEALQCALLRGFLLSVDGAHALHPNYTAKSDITNEVFLTKGPVIKTSASQRYLSDSEGTAVLMQICKEKNIPYQVQVNRSGMPGGQTLGPIAASYLPMQGADLGIPMLAMHSARELAAADDYASLRALIGAYFSL